MSTVISRRARVLRSFFAIVIFGLLAACGGGGDGTPGTGATGTWDTATWDNATWGQ